MIQSEIQGEDEKSIEWYQTQFKEKEDKMNEMQIELIKNQYTVKILLERIDILQNKAINERQDKNTKGQKINPTQHDLELNYNTKQNYMEELHEKIQQFIDLDSQNKFSSTSKKNDNLRFNYANLQDKHKRLKALYLKVKEKKKLYQEDSLKLNAIFEDSVKMRKILKEYYNNGNIDQEALLELKLDYKNPILDIQEESEEKINKEELKEKRDRYKSYTRQNLIDVILDLERKKSKIKKKFENLEEKIKVEKIQLLADLQKEKEARRDDNLNKDSFYQQKMKDLESTLMKKLQNQQKKMMNQLKNKDKEIEELDLQNSKLLMQSKIEMQNNQEYVILRKTNQQLQKKLNRLTDQVGELEREKQQKIQNIQNIKMRDPREIQNTIKSLNKEIANLEMDYKESNQSIGKLEEINDTQKLKNLITIKDNFITKMSLQMKNVIEDTNKEIANFLDLQNSFQILTREMQQREKRSQEIKSYVKELEDQGIDFMQKNSKLEIKIKEFEEKAGKFDSVTSECNLLKIKLAEKKEKIEELERMNEDQENLIVLNQNQNEILQKNLNENLGKIEEKEQNLAKQEKQLQRAKRLIVEIEQDEENNPIFNKFQMENQLEEKEMNNKKLMRQLRETKEELDRANQRYQQQLQTNKEYSKNIQDLSLLNSQIETQEKIIINLKYELQEKNKMIKMGAIEINKLEKKYMGIMSSRTQNMLKIEELIKYEQLINEIKEGKGDYIKLIEDKEKMAKQLAENQSYQSVLEEELTNLKYQFDNYSKNLQEKDKQIEILAKKYQKLSVKDYYKDMVENSAKEKLKKKEKEFREMKKKKALLDQQVLDFENEVKRYQGIMEEYLNKYPALKSQYDQLQEKHNEILSQIEELQFENQKLSQKLSIKNGQFDKLSNKVFMAQRQERNGKMLQERLKSRNIEVIELIKESNRLREKVQQLEKLVGNYNISENKQEYQGDILDLDILRKKYNMQLKGNEEVTMLYQMLINMEKQVKQQEEEKIEGGTVKGQKNLLIKYKNRFDQQKKQNQQLLEQNSQDRIELEIVREEIQKLEILNNTLNKKLKEQYQKIGELQGAQSALKVDLDQKQTLIASLRKDLFVKEKTESEYYDLYVKEMNTNKDNKVLINAMNEKIYKLQQVNDDLLANQQEQNGLMEELEKENQNLRDEIVDHADLFLKKAVKINSNEEKQNRIILKLTQEIKRYRKRALKRQSQRKVSKQEIKKSDGSDVIFTLMKNDSEFSPEAIQQMDKQNELENIIEQQNLHIVRLEEELVKVKNQNENTPNKNHSYIDHSDLSNFKVNQNQQRINQFLSRRIVKDSINKDHSECNERMKQLRKTINQLEINNDVLQKQINYYLQNIKTKKLEEEFPNYKNFVTGIQDDPLTIIKQNQMKNQIIEKEQMKNEKLKNNLENIMDDYEQMKGRENEIVAANRNLRKELEKALKEIHDFEQQDNLAFLNKLSKKKGKDKFRILKLLDEKDSYYKKILKLKDEELDRMSYYRDQNAIQRQKIQELRIKIQELERENEISQEKFEISISRAKEIEKKYDVIQKSHRAQEASRKILMEEKQSLKALNEEISQKLVKKENILKKHEDTINDLQMIIVKRQKKIEQLEELIRKQETFIESNQFDDEEMKIQIRMKQRQVDQLRNQLKNLQDKDIEINRLKRETMQLKNQVEKLLLKDIEIEELKRKYDQEIIELKEQISILQNDKRSLDQRRKSQEDDLINFERVIQKKDKDLEILKENIQTLLYERNEIEKENEDIQGRLERDFERLNIQFVQKVEEMKNYKKLKINEIDELKKDRDFLTKLNKELNVKLMNLQTNLDNK